MIIDLKTIKTLSIFFVINCLSCHAFGQGMINILELGGNADGITDNTKVIGHAIEKVSMQGGGTIYFPAGRYLTGSIKLESNITIFIDAGATLVFSDDFDQYLPFVEMRWEGTVMKSFSPLFYAYEKKNITITGRGRIDGQGKKWWDEHRKNVAEVKEYGEIRIKNKWQQLWEAENTEIEVSENYQQSIEKKFFRPPFIQFYKCKNILIEGITIVNSPFWTVNPEFCNNITVRSVTILNPVSPNTDGINPESCKNVHISDCHISVGDDCITIKSGRDKDGRKYNVPCENITITNCTMLKGHGGVVIGSEMSGSVRNVVISNCVFDGTDRGIRIKSMRGRGGIVEDIRVSNIVMKNIKLEAFMFNMMYHKVANQVDSVETPQFRNIHISGVTGSNVGKACMMVGLPEMPIAGVSFSNIQINGREGLEANTVNDLTLNNVNIDVQKAPPFIFINASLLNLQNIKSKKMGHESPLINLFNCSNIFIANCFPYPNTDTFLHAEGEKSEKIVVVNNNLINVTNKIQTGEGLKEGAIINKTL